MKFDYSKYFWSDEKILMRKPKPDDWEFLIHHIFDSQGSFFFNNGIDLPIDIEEYKDRTEFVESDELPYICFAIEDKKGKHVGIANLFNVDERNGTFGPIGICIDPADRGKGYAEAAYRMLGRYMFLERRMHKWNNTYIEGNIPSAGLHKKVGFESEGIQKDIYFHEGRYWNVVICGMTEKQFMENEKKQG